MINTDNIDFTAFYDSAQQLVEMYKQELEYQKVNASNTLSNSVDFDVDFDEDSITLYFNMAVYWYYIEYGRNATGGGGGQRWSNSVGEIEQWMQNKMAKGWFTPRNNGKIPRTPKEIRRISYAIVQKIHKVGFYGTNHQGLHILQQVLDKAESSGLLDQMVNSVVSGFDKEITVDIEKL